MAQSHETGLRLPAVHFTPSGTAQEIPDFRVTEFDINIMQRAVDLAAIALDGGDYPVGAVIVDEYGETFEGFANEFLTSRLYGHAEANAINRYNERTKRRSLEGTVMYVTQEPCVGCSAYIDQGKLSLLHQSTTREKCNEATMKEHGINVVRQRDLGLPNVLKDSPRQLTVVTGLLAANSIDLFLIKAGIIKLTEPNKR